MDARTRKMAGWVVTGVGVIVALIGALADQIGLGGEGPDEFGGRQVAAVIVGAVIAVVGLGVALWRPASTSPSDAGSTES